MDIAEQMRKLMDDVRDINQKQSAIENIDSARLAAIEEVLSSIVTKLNLAENKDVERWISSARSSSPNANNILHVGNQLADKILR